MNQWMKANRKKWMNEMMSKNWIKIERIGLSSIFLFMNDGIKTLVNGK